MRLELASYLDAIEEEAARFVDAPVPIAAVAPGRSSPLLQILGRARAALEAGLNAVSDAPVDERVRQRLDLDVLADEFVRLAGTFDDPLEAARTARALAIELTLLRVDLELTNGAPTGIDLELAIDGVAARLDELRDGPRVGLDTLGGSLSLVCADAPDAFLIEVTRGRLRLRERRGPADAVVVAPAAQLFALVYGREKADRLPITGSRAVLERFAVITRDELLA